MVSDSGFLGAHPLVISFFRALGERCFLLSVIREFVQVVGDFRAVFWNSRHQLSGFLGGELGDLLQSGGDRFVVFSGDLFARLEVNTTAPPKPSIQMQFILSKMEETTTRDGE